MPLLGRLGMTENSTVLVQLDAAREQTGTWGWYGAARGEVSLLVVRVLC